MKTKIMAIALCLVCAFNYNLYAQDVVGSYNSSYFNGKSYDLMISKEKDGGYSYYIGVEAENNKTLAYIEIESKDSERFKHALIEAKTKFIEWKNIAMENNVDKLDKDMPISFPNVIAMWKGTKWFFDFSEKFKLTFLKLQSLGEFLVLFNPKVVASSNNYITQKLYFVLSSEEEFDTIINFIDDDKSKSFYEKQNQKEDLFN